MIRLNVPDLVPWTRAPGLRPPGRGGTLAPDVGVVGLLLGAEHLDHLLGDDATGRLLDALEALSVKLVHRVRVADVEGPPGRGNYGGQVVVVVDAEDPPPLPGPGLRPLVVVDSANAVVVVDVIIIINVLVIIIIISSSGPLPSP